MSTSGRWRPIAPREQPPAHPILCASGLPFDDASGDRLRAWLGIERETFYDRSKIAILPMAFCFPGYNAAGSDLAPPPICAATWRERALATLPNIVVTLLIGGYAQNWHLGRGMTVSNRVAAWRDHAPDVFPLPHPSWRNTAWLRRNPWFETDLIPMLQTQIRRCL